ncbi:MAG: DUF1345 domain-containing protein, partial [Caulobacteraceae bacterium]
MHSPPMTWFRLHWPLALLVLIAASGVLWPVAGGWPSRVALAWDIGVGLFLIESAIKVMRTRSVDAIRTRASALDEAGPAILPLALIAAVGSVVVVVGEAATGGGGPAVLALVTVALSWLFVHVIFAFHYAHVFYSAGGKGDRGGLLFPGDDPEPDYWDFLHFSLIIGVASQTADVQITDRGVRRTST